MNNKKKNIELQDEITVDEYKAWLTGLLRGKGNTLPNLDDWKSIKKMTDKIVPDVVEVPINKFNYQFQSPQVMETPAPWHEQPSNENVTISVGTGNPYQDSVCVGSLAGGHYGCYGGSHASSYAPATEEEISQYKGDAFKELGLTEVAKLVGYKK